MVEDIKINNDEIKATHIRVCAYYDKGTESVHPDRNEARGIYLLVIPINITNRNGFNMVEGTDDPGVKYCICEMKRASSKKLQRADEIVKKYAERLSDAYQGISKYPLGLLAGIITDKMEEK